MFWRISSGCDATSKPCTVARPEVGERRPQRMRIVVDLPAPLGPRKPKISPGATSRVTRSTATKSPKRFTRFSSLTAGADGLGTGDLLMADKSDEDVLERGRYALPSE